MEIKLLDKESYTGQNFTVRYQTNGYYDLRPDAHGFRMAYTPFDTPVERSFDDVLYGEWLEDPVTFGAFEGETLIGFVEGSPETWNNRFRISNICIFDGSRRGKGIGARLIAAMLDAARASGARMAILETQSCNENAIAFYRRNGFDIVGFDLYAYSNTDPERKEVRIEMGKKLK